MAEPSAVRQLLHLFIHAIKPLLGDVNGWRQEDQSLIKSEGF